VNILADKVRSYYLKNIDSLPEDKIFHFLSRLASWSNDKECHELLVSQLPKLLPKNANSEIINMLQELIKNPPKASINAFETRKKYFDTYPTLRPIIFALFRTRHLKYLYNIETRQQLLELIPNSEMQLLNKKICADKNAIKILSTYAINYIYLTQKILYPEKYPKLTLKYFYDLGALYDTTDPEQIQLLIYLYTHCIIGESNFYLQHLSKNSLAVTSKMLFILEKLIQKNYININLDNKLEFLVCCKIANYKTSLFKIIHKECSNSISPNGMFVIDMHNTRAQKNKSSFITSEHRNVLFIMSCKPYNPGLNRFIK